jgi:phenylpyruvate tautomerase PptA (4-oxalocrotonate tautomerase family)
MEPKYPHITVKLTGNDSNAFMVLGLCQRAARVADLPKEEIDVFREEATAGDYNQLLQTAMRWFNID